MEITGLKKIEFQLNEKQLAEIQKGAELYGRHASIGFKIEEVNDSSITVKTIQEKSFSGNYLDVKGLIERTRSLFSRFFPNHTIHVHPVPFTHPEVDVVNVDWIQEKMKGNRIKLKEIAKLSGLDYTQSSSVVNGKRSLSQLMKAFLYYFFGYTMAKNEIAVLKAEKEKLTQEVETLKQQNQEQIQKIENLKQQNEIQAQKIETIERQVEDQTLSGIRYLSRAQKAEQEAADLRKQQAAAKFKSKAANNKKAVR